MTLWNNKQLQSALQTAHGANIQGGVNGAKFYFDNAKRFADPDFIPSKDDTLMARRKTVGIAETHFVYNGIHFTLVDVGGQRSERKKWLHCFESVTAVIFLTAINEYDMVLEEDATTNRLLESLKLWKALTGSNFFKNTPFILFLNKSDLFEAKIETVPLTDVFTDFEKVTSTSEFAKYDIMAKSWKYILKQFSSQFEGCSFHPHLTNALDTELCRKVFITLQDTIVAETLNLL
jgi:guanine nucleotide-binding protein subunit alpha